MFKDVHLVSGQISCIPVTLTTKLQGADYKVASTAQQSKEVVDEKPVREEV